MSKEKRESAIPGFLTALAVIAGVLAAAAGAFIHYCEKLQLLPLTPKGLAGRLGITAAACGLFFFMLFLLLCKSIRSVFRREWLPILLISLMLSVCVMIWFPMPGTGLYRAHNLSVRAVPDDSGEVRPVTLIRFYRKVRRGKRQRRRETAKKQQLFHL